MTTKIQPRSRSSSNLFNVITGKKISLILGALFILGAILRAVDIWQPIALDHLFSWREADVGGIARNYYREGMNLFYPRIDWGGDGPGFAEMEFPLFPWLIAVLYKIFGYNELFGRFVSYAFSLAAMGVFFRLAAYLLPTVGAIFASLFFVLSPLAIKISHSLQPEGLMFFCYILAAYAFIRWIDDNSWKYYAIALFATSLGILAKAPAAHIGLFFALLIFNRKGLVAFRQIRLWVFAVVALLPAILWYIHAHNFWLTYGNSLGVSNGFHSAGWELFTNSSFVWGIISTEVLHVWMLAGLAIAAFGAIARKSKRAVKSSLYWLIAIFVFYLIAARTTAADWAIYYHVISVPPAAILVGAGVNTIARSRLNLQLWVVFLAPVLAVVADKLFVRHLSPELKVWLGIAVFLVALVVVFSAQRMETWRQNFSRERALKPNQILMFLAVFAIAFNFLSQGRILYQNLAYPQLNMMYASAQEFKPAIPDNVLIVASAPHCYGSNGKLGAYNASYMFYWLDRKGFNICREQQSVEKLRSFAQRGAKYFVATKGEMNAKPGFESSVRQTFPTVRETDLAVLFKLTP
jgi:4-amino-4-deoxy-L-arabinose transferase-like glycosyltransferase